jgi:hypothetical protein
VGGIGFPSVTSMTFLPDGRLVAAQTPDDGVAEIVNLIEIDPASGAGTLIGTIGTFATGDCARMPGMTYHGGLGKLLGYGDGCFATDPEGLHVIDPATGAGTPIGASGFKLGGNGLAWDPLSGNLYATPHDAVGLALLDPLTGAASVLPGILPAPIGALAVHPGTGVLYGSYRTSSGAGTQTGDLIVIEPATGAVTTIGTTGFFMDSLAFVPGGTCDVRNGLGGNPVDFACTSTPLVGTTWTTSVSTIPSVGAATNATIVANGIGGPTSGALLFGGELLILPPFAPIDVANGTHALPVPADAALVGLSLFFQALRAEAAGPAIFLVPLNGLDVTIGM